MTELDEINFSCNSLGIHMSNGKSRPGFALGKGCVCANMGIHRCLLISDALILSSLA